MIGRLLRPSRLKRTWGWHKLKHSSRTCNTSSSTHHIGAETVAWSYWWIMQRRQHHRLDMNGTCVIGWQRVVNTIAWRRQGVQDSAQEMQRGNPPQLLHVMNVANPQTTIGRGVWSQYQSKMSTGVQLIQTIYICVMHAQIGGGCNSPGIYKHLKSLGPMRKSCTCWLLSKKTSVPHTLYLCSELKQ